MTTSPKKNGYTRVAHPWIVLVMIISVIIIITALWIYEDHLQGIQRYRVSEQSQSEAIKPVKERKYQPIWEDLDSRPLPEWYAKAKIGIMVHMGIYSVPGHTSEWIWYLNYLDENATLLKDYMERNYQPGFKYQNFAPQFTTEFFEPKQWAKLFKKSGAKYVVFTTKHQDGFTLFPSKQSKHWNSVDVGPHRDLVGDLAKAVKSAGLKFGVYYALSEWFNPMRIEDMENNFTTNIYPFNKVCPDIRQLVNDYAPSIVWVDVDWPADFNYWNTVELITWLYNESPVKDHVVVNDRWGRSSRGVHGDFKTIQVTYTSDYERSEDYFIKMPGYTRHMMKVKWEKVLSIDTGSWGYRRNIDLGQLMTTKEIIDYIVISISCAGNILINVGATKEGTIPVIFQERLLEIGHWLKLNGEAIYGTSPWTTQWDTYDPHVWYTCIKTEYNGSYPSAMPQESDTVTAIYAIFIEWPQSNILTLESITGYFYTTRCISAEPEGQFCCLKKKEGESRRKNNCLFTMLGQDDLILDYTFADNFIKIRLPSIATVNSKYAWAVRLTCIE